MLHTKTSKFILAVLLIAVGFTACKKDPFTEKDAIAAQSTLLQQMYSYQIQIAQINAAASRSSDSAKIAIQVLVNSGATSLAILQAQQNLAYLMQQYQNSIAAYKYQDSINNVYSFASSKFYDSLNNSTYGASLKKNYSIQVVDYVTATPVSGATVSVLPYNSPSIVTATTDANGTAQFTGLIVDPNANFYISKTNYATTLIKRSTIDGGTVPKLWNNGNAQNTVTGSVTADLDYTNGDALEGVSGQLITYSTSIALNQTSNIAQTFQFATVSDVNGNYSIKLPDASSYTVVIANQINAVQKMFVNYYNGENTYKVLPRLDSVPSVLQLNAGSFTTPPTVYGYYFSLPADSLLGSNLYIGFKAAGNDPLLNGLNLFNKAASGNDSIGIYLSVGYGGSYQFNNNANNTYVLNDPSYWYSIRHNWSPSINTNDTLPVTMVNLSPISFITTAPNIKAYLSGGKVQSISLNHDNSNNVIAGSSGTFAHSNLYTASNRFAIQNLAGVRPTPVGASYGSASQTVTTVKGGQTTIINYDYGFVYSRAKTVN